MRFTQKFCPVLFRPLLFAGGLLAGSICAFAESASPLPLGELQKGPVPEAVEAVGGIDFKVFPDHPERRTIRVRIPVTEPIKADQPMALSFRIRALGEEGQVDADAGQSGLVVRFGQAPEEGADNQGLRPRAFESIALASGDWQPFHIPFTTEHDFPAEQSVIEFAPVYFRQPVEVADIALEYRAQGEAAVRTGQAYEGQSPDAAWRAQADAMIQEHRTGDLRIEVIDPLGQPVEGAEVAVEMTRHAYPFGTAISAVRVADGDLWNYREDIDKEKFLEENQRYRKKLKELFNFVVFENSMKWPQWVGERGRPAQQWTFEALDWLLENDFLIKGHTMIWGSWRMSPSFLKDLSDDPGAVQEAILAHISDLGMATLYGTSLFDVVNEPMSHNDLIELVGPAKVAEWFKAARASQPETTLVVNDFDLVGNGGSPKRRAGFVEFVQGIREHGAPVDMIGFQAHFWSPRLTPPERIWAIADEVHEALGLPLMISEFDMNLNDEQLQADYTADFLKAWFAHPATEAYIMWGFWGGAHWMRDAGAMIRRDWTEKPNLKAYTDLVFGEWWTEENVKTNAEGTATVRAFYGDYFIRVTHPDGRSVHRNWTHDKANPGALIVQIPLQTEFETNP